MTAAPSGYDPVEAVISALREAGCHVETAGRDRYAAQCPAHDDRDPSLSIGRGDGKALIYCHAGCGIREVTDALGLGARQLFTDYDPSSPRIAHIHHLRPWRTPQERQQRPKPRPWRRVKVCHYDYVWPDGSPAMRVVRYQKVDKETGEITGKTFTQHRWDSELGRWADTLDDLDPPLYHADRVAEAVAANNPVFVCEGEKDADAVAGAWPMVATTCPMGADAWRPQHTEALRGAHVIVIADDDPAGLQHAQTVRDALEGVAVSIVVALPAEGYNDAADHIGAGYGVGDLRFQTTQENDAPEDMHTSWWPVDLDAIINGEGDGSPEPTHLLRDDGRPLFYPGRVNGILGESESGKTWVALLAAKQSLQLGQRVLYMDFEDTAAGIISRLKAMRVGLHNLVTLAYMSPDESLHQNAAEDFKAVIGAGYDLVIVDGFNAAMTLLGLDINNNNDATTFVQQVLKPIAATGSCVVYIDHVPKHKEGRGKGGIGAQAKRAMTTGCALSVEVAQPFGKGQKGRLRLLVDKDRPGKVRAVASESTYVGTVAIDSVDDLVEISVQAPVMDGQGQPRPSRAMQAVSELLESSGAGMSQTKIEDAIMAAGYTRATVRHALRALVAEHYCEHRDGPRNSLIYTLLSPFSDDEGE